MTDRQTSRRHYLLAAGALALAGCSGGSADDEPTATDDDEPTATPSPTTTTPTATSTGTPTPTGPYGGWFSDTENFEETVDRTGEQTVTVRVGAQGNGGALAFDPPAVRVSPGATVRWEWVEGRHNVAVQSQPGDADWDGYPQQVAEPGFTYEHVFDTRGVYLYYCTPHLPKGMKGALVVDGDRVDTGGGTTEADR
jgi:halocyanin-like protein